MCFEEFISAVEGKVKERVSASVFLDKVKKNNGMVFHGLGITVPGSQNAVPVFRLEEYYELYLTTGMGIDAIAEDIIAKSRDCRNSISVDISWFSSYQNVRDNIFYKLVNKEANKSMLEDVPYSDFLDLAKVYYVLIGYTEEGTATAMVYHKHLQMWGITESELKEQAERNMDREHSVYMKRLDEYMEEIMGAGFMECMMQGQGEDTGIPMYVVSNKEHCNGASAICCKGVLKEFADTCESDVVILPSSIHETILVPLKADDKDIAGLRDIVKQINHTEVALTERLSDNVYVYRRDSDTIEMA